VRDVSPPGSEGDTSESGGMEMSFGFDDPSSEPAPSGDD
jgi:hypothetical protein